MLFITTYRAKPFMTKDEVKELMAISAAYPAGPEEVAHYVAADGSHGVIVSDLEDASTGYVGALRFSSYLEFESRPMLRLDDALPHLLAALD